MAHARVTNQAELRYCPHTSVSGETGSKVKTGVCTGNGDASGTTIVDSAGDSGGADTYNGRYCVKILSGACKGQIKRVIDDDGAGTLTLEGAGYSAQIVTGVEYEIRTLPDPCVVVDSSSGETNMVDAIRVEADVGGVAFWKGYYACPITGTHRGKMALITGCVAATGTFTLAASFGSALAAGDVVVLRKFVEAASVNRPDGPPMHARPILRNNFSVGKGTIGPRGGTVSFTTQVTASNSLAAADAGANGSVISGLFQAAGLVETVGKSAAVDVTNASASAVLIATGKRENLDVGYGIIWDGNFAVVASLADGGAGADTVNVTPSFPAVPPSGATLYGTRRYAKSTDGDVLGCLIEYEEDGVRYTMTGCKGNVSLADAAPLALNWSFSADDWWEEVESAPWIAGSAYTTAFAIEPSDRKAYLSTVATDIGGFTASPNSKVVAKNVSGATGHNARAGYQLVDSSGCGATYRRLVESSGELVAINEFLLGTQKDLIVVYGTHGNTFAVRLPAAGHKQYPKTTGQDGLQASPSVVQAEDAGTALNNTTVTKVPDFAFFLS